MKPDRIPSIKEIREVCQEARAELLRMQAELAAVRAERDTLGRRVLRLELALSCALPILEAGEPGGDAATVAALVRASCDDVRLPRPPRGKPRLHFINNDPFRPVADIMAGE